MRSKIEFAGLPSHIEIMNIREIPLHSHECLQILFVLQGEIEVFLTMKTYTVKEGEVHYIHFDDIHSIKGNGSNIVMIISLDIDFATSVYPRMAYEIISTKFEENLPLFQNERMLLLASITNLAREYFANNKSRSLEIKTRELIDLLYENFRSFHCVNESVGFQRNRHRDTLQVDRISCIIAETYIRYAEKLSLTELADKEHVSKYYISHLFQKYTGLGFRDFLSMVRVERALYRVLTTDDSIDRIALDYGFSHINFFKKNFERWYGISAEAFREKNKHSTIEYKRNDLDLLSYKDIENKLSGLIKPTLTDKPVITIIPEKINYKTDGNKINITIPEYGITSKEYLHLMELLHGRDPDMGAEYTFKIDGEAVESSADADAQRLKECGCSALWEKLDFRKDIQEFRLYGDKGLFSHNGLRQPDYCLFSWLLEFPKNKYHFASGVCGKSNDGYVILIKNENVGQSMELQIELDKNEKYVLCHEYITDRHATVLNWSKLDFLALDQKNMDTLNTMSTPSVELFTNNPRDDLNIILMEPSSLNRITVNSVTYVDA